jgi:hypothetical protein|nr:MAG TPA: DNA REPAIR PROTEIN RAD52 HOMOLOG-BINDING PROTEIN, DNA REPAIR, DNA.7A [Caudoviricetes sp.]
MNNLELYDKFRKVPDTAKKNIGGGRLKGMTDINPMWRIKTLTEEFGICGFGWYYEITDKWIETSMAKDEITANVKINLYVKRDNEWSKPIVGIGGSMLVANEKNGLYVNDECYKMALTDAISVACKSLGIGADVYWNKDNTKYNDGKKNQAVAPKEKTLTYREKLIIYAKEAGIPFAELAKDYDLNSKTTEERFKEVLEDLEK